MKNVLFIVYYFPPMGSSGVQRPLKFVKYLPDYGWKPIVLAPVPGSYHTFDKTLLNDLKGRCHEIYRIDAKTPFHIGTSDARKVEIPDSVARYLRAISQFFWLPDNKIGWIKPALKQADKIIAKENIDLIYSTAPPYSNHLIAAKLKRKYGIPTVMDMRDEWLESHLISYPTRFHRWKMAKIERKTLSAADLITVINQPTKQSISQRLNHTKNIKIIRQGFDPQNFESPSTQAQSFTSDRLTFLYSGIFYGKRTPETFLKGVSEAVEHHPPLKNDLELQFQGGLEKEHLELISKLKLDEMVVNYGYISHAKAVENLQKADVLWFNIGHKKFSNRVTVGKLFEYFGAQKPIFGLIPEGGSKELLKKYGSYYTAEPHNVESVRHQILAIWKDWKNGSFQRPNIPFIKKYNRKNITNRLANSFNEVLKT